jgi:SAM-dependent methyltransferase
MADYDDFAWFYNRYWNEEFHAYAFPILERIWLTRVPAGARILDVCCGTGYLSGLLSARGYRAGGVDLSPSMIRHARENVPGADFEVLDIAAAQPPGRFDAAVSTFDSLNHIIESGALESAFRHIGAALELGAPFAFDMLMESAYQTHWGESFALVRDDHVLTITGSGYDFRTRLGQCTITMFRMLDAVWRRSDALIRERCYTPAEIEQALRGAGFGEIECYDAGDLGMAGQLGEGRTFFVAVRQ